MRGYLRRDTNQFQITVSWFSLFMLFLFCLQAAAATVEQEIQAEGQKLIPRLFSKCGEDYVSKRTFHRETGDSYTITQVVP